MKALIVTNGYYRSGACVRQAERIEEELRCAGCSVTTYDTARLLTTETTFDADLCVFLDKNIPFAKLLEEQGIRVFNTAEAIATADDKGLTAAVLSGKVKQQTTVFRPKRYSYDGRDESFLRDVEKSLGYPMVAKFSHGSLGEQVSLVRSFAELAQADEKMGDNDGIFQAFRAESTGKSYRVIVVGGKAIGAMALRNDSDFRSNAHGGGVGAIVRPDSRFYATAEKAARLLGLDYAGVDLFFDDDVVIEVNGNAYFDEFEKRTGINVAKAYVDYMAEVCGK